MERGESNQRGHKPVQIFGDGVHELKLGRSFQQDNSSGFHTIRYDFKPASVDHSKEASLDVGESNEVNITFPNVENKGPDSTVFGGSKKPYQKECVLIYDHRTGEFTLERLSCNIQVKRQRQEGTSKAQLSSRPLSGSSKSSPNPRSSAKRKETTPTHSPAPPAEVKVERSPAPQPSPPTQPSPPPSLQPSPPPSAPCSVPSAGDKAGDSSDSYMSASDSDDDDSSSSSSGSSSSDQEEEVGGHDGKTGRWNDKQDHHSNASGMARKPSPMQPSPLSRLQNVSPQLSQLSKDLQLSESSGSDSDSD